MLPPTFCQHSFHNLLSQATTYTSTAHRADTYYFVISDHKVTKYLTMVRA